MARRHDLKVLIVPEVQARLESKLDLRAPVSVRFTKEPLIEGTSEEAGHYKPLTRKIFIRTSFSWLENTSLPLVRSSIVNWLLHEFRHAHQRDHWPAYKHKHAERMAYNIREEEIDARQWAAENTTHFLDLIQIRIQRHKPYDFSGPTRGFGRLSEVSR